MLRCIIWVEKIKELHHIPAAHQQHLGNEKLHDVSNLGYNVHEVIFAHNVHAEMILLWQPYHLALCFSWQYDFLRCSFAVCSEFVGRSTCSCVNTRALVDSLHVLKSAVKFI